MPSANGTNGNGTNGHAPVLALEPPAKHPGGRPSDYRPEYCEAVLAWFDGPRHERVVKKRRTIPQKGAAPAIEEEYEGQITRFPTFEGFAKSLQTTRETLSQWRKAHPEFADAYKRAKEAQKDWLIEIGLRGIVPVAAYIFTAKNVTDMRDDPAAPPPRHATFVLDPFRDHRELQSGSESQIADRADNARIAAPAN